MEEVTKAFNNKNKKVKGEVFLDINKAFYKF
jgi:hypothetical protein